MPPKIIAYHTCTDTSVKELDVQIATYLKDGWQPYLEQTVIHDRYAMVNIYSQVMVKYQEAAK